MNKGFRFILSLVLVVVMVCGAVGCLAEGAPVLEAGSIVTFGRYPQTAAGTDETRISWIVLEVDEVHRRALLLSEYGLDAKPYHAEGGLITWEDCSLRSWLNGEFLLNAFNPDEQSIILLTDVDNSPLQGYSGYEATGGNNTQDYIFLLSIAEVYRYMNVRFNAESVAARVDPTAYAIKQGAYTSSIMKTADGRDAGLWWLRSPGYTRLDAAYVDSLGSFDDFSVRHTELCVRPALWISLD